MTAGVLQGRRPVLFPRELLFQTRAQIVGLSSNFFHWYDH